MDITLGINAYGVRRELIRSGDRSILEKLKDCGADAFEPMLCPVSAESDNSEKWMWSVERASKSRKICDGLGLTVPSAQIMLGFGSEMISSDEAADYVHAFYEASGIESFIIIGLPDDRKEAARLGIYYSELKDKTSDLTVNIMYHNHDAEFYALGDTDDCLAIDVIMENAGKGFLLEYDIGWAAFAGDEIRIAESLKDSIAVLHCKDFFPEIREYENRFGLPESIFSPIGDGIVKTREVIDMALKGVFPNWNGLIIIDQDDSAGDVFADTVRGFDNLRDMSGRR